MSERLTITIPRPTDRERNPTEREWLQPVIDSALSGVQAWMNGAGLVCAPALSVDADGGVERIAAERQRQIDELWGSDHDDQWDKAELADAAGCYVGLAATLINHPEGRFFAETVKPSSVWPWDSRWWQPNPDPIRNLVKAGALIAAEIDRLLRVSQDDADAFAQNQGP